jgi:hypothetical protein
MMVVSRMRKKFDKSLEIDETNRARIVETIKNHTAVYSEEETRIIDDGAGFFKWFDGKKSKKMKMDSPLTTARMAFNIGDSHAWGWASTVVRATPEEVLSYAFDVNSRATQSADDLERTVEETPNDHNVLLYVKKQTPKIGENRDFLNRCVWKVTDGVFLLVLAPQESVNRPALPGVVRGRYPSALKITRMNANEAKLEYTIHPDAGGALPAWLSNNWVKASLEWISDIRESFQSFRRLSQWDAEDGRALGETMVIKTQAEKYRLKGESKYDARLRVLFEKDRGLGEIGKKHAFFQSMMSRVVENKLRSAGDVSTKLINAGRMEGRKIGAGLAASLASNLTAEAAVDEWTGKYPALRELDRAEIWFRPMMNTVAQRLLSSVSWGLKFRVFSGAGMSMLDMVSDSNVIVLYLGSSDTEGHGMVLLWMLVSCVLLQLLVVYCQHRGKKKHLLKEGLVVLTGLKPGKLEVWDAYFSNSRLWYWRIDTN